MKRILAVAVGMFMLFLLPGISICASAPATPVPEGKSKPAKKVVIKAKSLRKGPYVSGQFGMTLLPDLDVQKATFEFQPGYAMGIAAGYKYGKLRVEGEIGYRKNDIDKCIAYGKERSVSGYSIGESFMVNGYYDFINKTAFTPYITAGIGVSKLESNDLVVAGRDLGSDDDTVLAYQVGAGVGYAINKKYTIDLKYRFSSATQPEFRGNKVDVASHNIFLGLRYNF